MAEKRELATFAGGCFWCMVKPFDEQPGILKVESGYTGGHTENPTYEEVCSNTTGHREAVQITFDPDVFPYENCWNSTGSKSIPLTAKDNSQTAESLTGQRFLP